MTAPRDSTSPVSPASRRRFLIAAAIAPLAGCGRREPDDLLPWESVQNELSVRANQLAALRAAGPKPPGATPAPPADVLAAAPELRALTKLTHRLHPRFAEDLRADESNLGGPVLWPDGEPFPAAADGRLLVPVLQLRAEDAPPQAKFKPGSDLVQLFWDARAVRTKGPRPSDVRLVWRKRADVAAPVTHPLAGLGARPDDPAWREHRLTPTHVPVPCRFTPERVLEFPGADVLPERARAPLFAALPGGEAAYRDALSTAPGTKAGGYGRRPEPACPACKRATDYLLTVGGPEWFDTPRWKPAGATDLPAEREAATLPGWEDVSVCRRCPDWPGRLAD